MADSDQAGKGAFGTALGSTIRGWIGRVTPARAEVALAAVVVVVGLAGALSTLGRGAWLDEFWTLASSKPGMTLAEFLDVMSREVHPILHYGLAWVAQALGLTDLAGLRALNILGVPAALGALWFAHRRSAITTPQACVIAALYASSAMFLDYFAELRAYFLVHSFSLAVALLWRVMARWPAGRRPEIGVLVAWGLALAIFVNLHYFATLLGGLLTAALMLQRRLCGVVALAAVSAAAAVPAVLMALVHAGHADAAIVSWVQTGRVDGVFVILDIVWAALAQNIVAAGCAVAVVLFAIERRESWRDYEDEIALVGALVVYFGLLVVLNAMRPIIVDRYLIAASGPVVAAAGLLAGRASAPRWAAAAVCLFALLTQARNLYAGTYAHDGWRESADFVAGLVEDCPTSKVYIAPTMDLAPDSMLASVRRLGLEYYADRAGLTVEEARPGDTLASDPACPTVVWMEHTLQLGTTRAARLLENSDLRWTGAAEVVAVGSGAVIVIR